MGDWLSGIGDFFGGIGASVSNVFDDVGTFAGDVWSEVSGIFGDADPGSTFEGVSWPEVAAPLVAGLFDDEPQAGPADVVMGDDGMNGDNGYGMVRTGGLGGAVVAGGIWLGSYLARSLGRGAAGVVFTAANGVRVKMGQLWPLVRRYGPEAVAGGLGIGAGALGTLLATPEAISGRGGRRGGRGRGISARDVKTTRRTLKSIKKLYNMMPTRPTRSWSGGSGRYYRKRR